MSVLSFSPVNPVSPVKGLSFAASREKLPPEVNGIELNSEPLRQFEAVPLVQYLSAGV
jgi:hypothetical protein